MNANELAEQRYREFVHESEYKFPKRTFSFEETVELMEDYAEMVVNKISFKPPVQSSFVLNETVIMDKGCKNESKVIFCGMTRKKLISVVRNRKGERWEVMTARLSKQN